VSRGLGDVYKRQVFNGCGFATEGEPVATQALVSRSRPRRSSAWIDRSLLAWASVVARRALAQSDAVASGLGCPGRSLAHEGKVNHAATKSMVARALRLARTGGGIMGVHDSTTWHSTVCLFDQAGQSQTE
jgi:hypothetical protein